MSRVILRLPIHALTTPPAIVRLATITRGEVFPVLTTVFSAASYSLASSHGLCAKDLALLAARAMISTIFDSSLA
jgi:hypothetical protein